MSYYGDPEWYNRWVYPLRDAYLQPEKADVVRAPCALERDPGAHPFCAHHHHLTRSASHQRLSETPAELRDQLAELKAKRLQKREERGGRVGWPHESHSATQQQSLSTLGGGFAAPASPASQSQEPQQPPPTRLV